MPVQRCGQPTANRPAYRGDQPAAAHRQRPRRRRVGELWWTAAAAAILVLARLLPPSPTGFGTHMRILPVECLFRRVVGLPCPGCGLTTSFALCARGRWAQAFAAHYLGPAGFVGAWLVLAWGVLGALGYVRGPSGVLDRPAVLYALAAIVLCAWVARLWIAIGGHAL